MTLYTIAFLFISLFTVMVGIGAVFFISFDAKPGDNPLPKSTTQNLYRIVRRVNTETIETVDASGSVQTWTRSI